jgi:putative redox protein
MHIEISNVGRWKFNAKCRGHQIVSDQPLEEEGEDTGMTPVELFASSLGCCIGVYAKIFCDRHKIPSENMRIDLEWQMAKNPSRIGEVKARIDLKQNIDPELQQGIIRMTKHCTVHNTLMNPPKIEVLISKPPMFSENEAH